MPQMAPRKFVSGPLPECSFTDTSPFSGGDLVAFFASAFTGPADIDGGTTVDVTEIKVYAEIGGLTVGYREMGITKDGTSLANDVLAWGLGYGSTAPVFHREIDAPSESRHGLWQ